MIFKDFLQEAYDDLSNDWIHYSDYPYIKINYRPFHRDPLGIYLFPKSFKTKGMWKDKKYRFTIQVPPALKVLDLAKITPEECIRIAQQLTGKDDISQLMGEYKLKPSPYTSATRVFWEYLTNFFGRDKAGAFNTRLRKLGYDAVFDDTNSIFNGEDQLVILNPGKIKVINMETNNGTGYEQLMDVMTKASKVLEAFGVITINKPKSRGYGKNVSLKASISVKASEDFYATWDLSTSSRRDLSNHATNLFYMLGWSNPRHPSANHGTIGGNIELMDAHEYEVDTAKFLNKIHNTMTELLELTHAEV